MLPAIFAISGTNPSVISIAFKICFATSGCSDAGATIDVVYLARTRSKKNVKRICFISKREP